MADDGDQRRGGHWRVLWILVVSIGAGVLATAPPPAGASLWEDEFAARSDAALEPVITGQLKRWHPVTITFDGPQADEGDAVNPFRDYRLNVTFRHEGTDKAYVVPGYFAADGNAAESSATGGTKWRVHFTPEEVGDWAYTVSFRGGSDVAVRLAAAAGEPLAFDGMEGSFTVAETDKTGADLRGKGMLRYVGEHHLRFDNGEWFLKGGVDSPETLLAYEDFDDTSVHGGTQTLRSYQPHIGDWREGDPVWQGGRGKGLIGALNYLAGKGLNAISFLTMNVDGDGKNVWPWVAHDVHDRYDVSKLDQWEKIFTHADSLGMYLHFKTQETENDHLLDGGDLGVERKLYYRELIARFGHHLALNWNLGEEHDLWEELDDPRQMRVRSYAQYIRALDPYEHHVVIHSYPGQQVEVYVPLLGNRSEVTGASLQTYFDQVYEHTRLWVTASRAAGKKWVVANDEQGNSSTGVKPDGEGNNHDEIRHHTLWGNLMAGGAGVEYYFGYQFAHNDLNLDDFRSRDRMFDYTRHALEFFREYLPFWEMNSQGRVSSGDSYVLAKAGEVYAVYLPPGNAGMLNLGGSGGSFTVEWFNPREGGALQTGSVPSVVASGGQQALGTPPVDDGGDWVVLVRAAR